MYQEREGGIAEALGLAEDFADKDPICVVLGDNLIEYSINQVMGIGKSRLLAEGGAIWRARWFKRSPSTRWLAGRV
jgi:hypothetical protein